MGAGEFRTTRWSLVQASAEQTSEGRAALGELCERYWSPLYVLARRNGLVADLAEDAVQGFFEGVIRRDDFARADQDVGSFRAFLRTAFRRYLMNEAARSRTLKRGGGAVSRPLDPELHYESLADAGLDPAALFERAFALRTIEAALEGLRRTYISRDKEAHFDALRTFITAPDEGPGGKGDRAAAAEALGLTRNALDVAIHRMRSRYREALLGAVRDVIRADADVGEELRWMFDVL